MADTPTTEKFAENDLIVETWNERRGTGVYINGVNSAPVGVKITHKPTGIVVTCDSEMSQLRNKALALACLRSRLLVPASEEEGK